MRRRTWSIITLGVVGIAFVVVAFMTSDADHAIEPSSESVANELAAARTASELESGSANIEAPARETGHEPTSRPVNEEEPPRCLDVIVVDEKDDPIGGVFVTMLPHHQALPRRATTRGDGRVRFEAIEKGKYDVGVAQPDLPDGWAAASLERPIENELVFERYPELLWMQTKRVTFGDDGAASHLTIRMVRSAVVTGRILDDRKRPVEGVHVRIESVYHPAVPDTHDLVTDPDGRFMVTGVRPFSYAVEIRLSHLDPSIARLAPPLIQPFELGPGERRDYGDLCLGAGPCGFEGRVVDQDGQPVAGMYIVVVKSGDQLSPIERQMRNVFLFSLRTDDAGVYRIDGAHSGWFRLEFAGWNGYLAHRPPEENLLSRWVDPIECELSPGDHKTLEDTVVWLARPFKLEGNVGGGDGLEHRAFATTCITIEPADPALLGVREAKGRLPLEVATLKVDEVGAFDWSCVTPHAAMRLRIRKTAHDPVIYERLIDVQPNGRVSLGALHLVSE